MFLLMLITVSRQFDLKKKAICLPSKISFCFYPGLVTMTDDARL